MELKRKYRETRTENGTETKKNRWPRTDISLTGIYYHLSRYGESISRPILSGVIIVFLATMFWLTQSNPTLEPHFPPTVETVSTSTFVGFREIYSGYSMAKIFREKFCRLSSTSSSRRLQSRNNRFHYQDCGWCTDFWFATNSF